MVCPASRSVVSLIAWVALSISHTRAHFARSSNRTIVQLSRHAPHSPLPASLDWRNVNGHSYASAIRQEHAPRLCGSCWVFAALSSLSDRMRILQGPLSRQVDLSPQAVLNCNLDGGCNSGGDPIAVYRFAHEHGIPEETCQPYEGEGHDTGRSCEATDVCRTCDPINGCLAVPIFNKYFVSEYGNLNGTDAMLKELQRGPMACTIGVTPKFQNWTGDGIFDDDTSNIVSKNMSGAMVEWMHSVSIVGYGADNGKDYWVARNSWGTWWGDHGWFRIARGRNNVLVESDCTWALPRDGGWRELYNAGGASVEPVQSRPACRFGRNDWEAVGGERLQTARPHEFLAERDLPKSWDWRNVSGVRYTTWDTNELAPAYCGSCWAQAVSSAISDRISIQNLGRWPQVELAPQVLINCGGVGSCNGGNPAGAHAYIHRNGLTDQTCQPYSARDLKCDDLAVCMTCASPYNDELQDFPGTCVPVPSATELGQPFKFHLSEYGRVVGSFPMMAEIYKRGPISCGMQATRGFERYEHGVYSESVDDVRLTHEVSVAGWGKTASEELFWIGRNSWGTHWGEAGWFRIVRDSTRNLGIETDCSWGVPGLTHLLLFA